MKKLIFVIIFFSTLFSFGATDYPNLVPKKEDQLFIKNTREQIQYLVRLNKQNKTENEWYIYIPGRPLEDLQYLINKSKNTFSSNYLNTLNNNLQEINTHEDTAVYVAFTDYENEILTPVFPYETNTFSKKEAYIRSLLSKKDSENGTETELNKSLEQFTTYTKEFRNLIKQVFNEDFLKEIEKPNLILPFSNYTFRSIIQKNTTDYKKKKFLAYTIYTPKSVKKLSRGKLNKILSAINATSGQSFDEQKIDKVVEAIRIYLFDDTFQYKECEELLEKYKNKPILTEFPSFRKLAENDPCVLKQVIPWGEDIQKSEWMTITEQLIVIPLYAALAIPAASIAGEELVRQFGREKIKDAAQAAAMNIAMQTVINYYFGDESITSEKDTEERWKKALYALDKYEFSKEVLTAIKKLNTRQEIVVACIEEGVKIENMNWQTFDMSDAKIKINLKGCVGNVAKLIFIDKPKDKALGYLFKKLKTMAQRDPKKFIKAWRELQENFLEDFKIGTNEWKKDVLDATGISSLNKKITDYIKSSFKVEDDLGDAIKDYSKNSTETSDAKDLENTIKDVATETDVKINNNVSESIEDGVNALIKKQGANITLKLTTVDGETITIKASLLEELEMEGKSIYRMIFVNNKKTVDEIAGSLSDSRKRFTDAIKSGNVAKIEAKGGNADKFLGIKDQKIDITDIEVRSVDANGNVVRKKIGEGSNTTSNTSVDDLLNAVDSKYKTALETDLKASEKLKTLLNEQPELLDNWKKMKDLDVNPSLRRNPEVLKKTKTFNCN